MAAADVAASIATIPWLAITTSQQPVSTSYTGTLKPVNLYYNMLARHCPAHLGLDGDQVVISKLYGWAVSLGDLGDCAVPISSEIFAETNHGSITRVTRYWLADLQIVLHEDRRIPEWTFLKLLQCPTPNNTTMRAILEVQSIRRAFPHSDNHRRAQLACKFYHKTETCLLRVRKFLGALKCWSMLSNEYAIYRRW